MAFVDLYRSRALVVTATLALILAGCGGGGDGDTPSSGTPAPSQGVNAVPSMQGTAPSTVLVGQSYSFQPSASDADGDSLQFTAANVPAWLSFNAQSGALTGTPASSDLGTYNNITITVSDGKTTTVFGPFSITVTDSAVGTAAISWTAPSQNTDGTPLADLSGFRVLYGTSPAELTQTITIDNPSLSSYVVPNLTSGTWYFAVVSVNSSGIASSPSNVASKTVS